MTKPIAQDMKVLRQFGRALQALETLKPHERRAVQRWLVDRVRSDLRRRA